ncbi:hypothetical protein ACFE04_031463 [Oxalis oulophora]
MAYNNSGTTTPYSKFVLVRASNKNHILELNDPNETVLALKLRIMEELSLGYPEDSFDLSYEYRHLPEDEIVGNIFSRWSIQEGCPVDVKKRIMLTIQGKDRHTALYVNPAVWTVGRLKTKLHQMPDFPKNFELQHPDQPGKNLDDATILLMTGPGVPTRLLAVEND